MESFCLRTGMYGIDATSMISMNLGASLDNNNNNNKTRKATTTAAANSSSKVKTTVPQASPSLSSSFMFSFKYPFKYLWPRSEQRCKITVNDVNNSKVLMEKPEGDLGFDDGEVQEGDDQNWGFNILHAKLRLNDEEMGGGNVNNGEKCNDSTVVDGDDDENCDVCKVIDDDKEDEIDFDRALFSSLLKKVSMADAKFYAKLSYLGKLAYSISKIQPENLLGYYQLRFVTSSLEKKEQLSESEKGQEGEVKKEEELKEEELKEEELKEEELKEAEQKNISNQISTSAAYQIAASAASYLHSQTRSILPFKASVEDDQSSAESSDNNGSCTTNESVELMSPEMASFMATTTESMTAVVGAKEDVKQAVADDLNSLYSSPCNWYICDDDRTGTRYFVIQGSESLASWQANLLFEPVEFEKLDVLVHRGIYEAARGIYEHMLPEVRAHLKSHGDRATLRFTGHSLGGSLALLVNLMLLIRGEVPVSSLLPVIGFGAPYVMCGGDHLLHKLGLPRNHFQGVAMHRDIVPRAFSSLLSNHIVELIKAVNGKFRSHPCLNNQKFLFAPMGDLLILQPDDKFSPHHHLLPPGNGLYLLTKPLSGDTDTEKLIQSATKVFLNSPHPLEILSDRAAYGSEGTIIRDHDMGSYLKSIRSVIRQDLNRIRKAKREHRRTIWWPTVTLSTVSSNVIVGGQQPKTTQSCIVGQRQFNFSGVLQSGRDSFKRFSRLIASQHMHLLVVMLYPARSLLFESFRVNSLH